MQMVVCSTNLIIGIKNISRRMKAHVNYAIFLIINTSSDLVGYDSLEDLRKNTGSKSYIETRFHKRLNRRISAILL